MNSVNEIHYLRATHYLTAHKL